MSNWDQFINVVLKGDYFIIFMVVLMIVILAIILYLVKLQVGGSGEEDYDDGLVSEDKIKVINKEIKEMEAPKITQVAPKKEEKEKKILAIEKKAPVKKDVIVKKVAKERPIYVQDRFNFNEEELKNDTFQVSDDVFEKTQELKNLVSELETVKKEKVVSGPATVKEEIKKQAEVRKKPEVVKHLRKEENVGNINVENEINALYEKEGLKEEVKENVNNENFNKENVEVKNNSLEERVQILNRIQSVTAERQKSNEQREEVKRNAGIKDYEKEQEESAIISYEELHKRKDDIEKGVFKLSDEVIENYEEEQEKKAIISYDELLEKASSTILTYREEEVPGIKVNRIDTTDKRHPKPIEKPYMREEEFLKALKEFRATL